MAYDTLISVDQLIAARNSATPILLLDCSVDLADRSAGRRAYEAGHIPGAFHVDLEKTLSGKPTGKNGRHPLPSKEDFVQAMAALGASNQTQIVAYDNVGGMCAARLWWMLRWVGHSAAAVLDGGPAAWVAAGQPLSTTVSAPERQGDFNLRSTLVSTIDYEGMKANVESRQKQVLDARMSDRFQGENETLDPIGGHIPGARNRFFRDNLAADGSLKSAEQLRQEFAALTDGRPASEVINQCGSGVSACHNLLAMEVAGLKGAALYPGSWSEWSAQPGAPIATGMA